MFRDTLTADGYTTAINHRGGPTECRITFNSGSGTCTLLRAPKDLSRASAANYEEFSSSTTVTASTAIGIQPGDCWLCFQVSGGSSPNITVELSGADPRHVEIADTDTQVS